MLLITAQIISHAFNLIMTGEKTFPITRLGSKNLSMRNAQTFNINIRLLMRYYMRYGGNALPEDGSAPTLTWAGAKDIERAILVAPPNAGSLDALEQLVEGFNTGRPLLPYYPPEILGTFPSLYQLLPRPRHNAIVWDEDETRPVKG